MIVLTEYNVCILIASLCRMLEKGALIRKTPIVHSIKVKRTEFQQPLDLIRYQSYAPLSSLPQFPLNRPPTFFFVLKFLALLPAFQLPQ